MIDFDRKSWFLSPLFNEQTAASGDQTGFVNSIMDTAAGQGSPLCGVDMAFDQTHFVPAYDSTEIKSYKVRLGLCVND